MHIDAVLEFVIEYPLDWQKDRRVIYGTSNGEVRWSHQTHSGDVMLRVISKKNAIPANISENQLSEQFLDYPDLTQFYFIGAFRDLYINLPDFVYHFLQSVIDEFVV